MGFQEQRWMELRTEVRVAGETLDAAVLGHHQRRVRRGNCDQPVEWALEVSGPIMESNGN